MTKKEPIIVNDPNNLPVKIFCIERSRIKFLHNNDFFEVATNPKHPQEGCVKTDSYYLLNTTSSISWLQPSQPLSHYHLFLTAARRLGYSYVMITNINNENKKTT